MDGREAQRRKGAIHKVTQQNEIWTKGSCISMFPISLKSHRSWAALHSGKALAVPTPTWTMSYSQKPGLIWNQPHPRSISNLLCVLLQDSSLSEPLLLHQCHHLPHGLATACNFTIRKVAGGQRERYVEAGNGAGSQQGQASQG